MFTSLSDMHFSMPALSDLAHDDQWWVLQVFIVVTLTVILHFVTTKLIRHLRKRALLSSSLWDDALLHAAEHPLGLLIWLLGISMAASIVQQQSTSPIFNLIQPLQRIGLVGLATWFLVRALKFAESNYNENPAGLNERMDRTTLSAITNLGKISVIITGILVGMQSMGYSISGVLAFGGVGGIAIGFAAKDLLANLFGSLIIFLDRPFQIGDWIRSPDREIEGTVEHIGWRMTIIRSFSKNPLYIPNAAFSTIAIENPSRMTHRRIHETIGIRYSDFGCMQAIVEDVRSMLIEHPEIDNKATLMVNFKGNPPIFSLGQK